MTIHCPACFFACSPLTHLCPQCGQVIPTTADIDYFSVLGLPRKIRLNEDTLKNNFLELSKNFHPDRIAQFSESARPLALEKSVLINNAFQTLKDKTRRIQYLLKRELGDRGEQSGKVPLELFELVEEINEDLQAYRSAQSVERAERSNQLSSNGTVATSTKKLEQHLADLQQQRREFESLLFSTENEWDLLCEETQNFSFMQGSVGERRKQLLQILAKQMDSISYIDSLICRIKDTLFER